MAFKYGTTSPTEIIYNGTSLTVLKYGENAVWGKPYSLSISQGENTTVIVNRTASPNQQAELGVLSDGSVIYYGDVLTISYSISSGYQVDIHTINNNTFTSGTQVTVTEPISIIVTAQTSQSWHTIWTGSQYVTTNKLITTTPVNASKYKVSITTINEVWSFENPQIIDIRPSEALFVYGLSEITGGDVLEERCGHLSLGVSETNGTYEMYFTFLDKTGVETGDLYSMVISKIEAYY